MAFNGTINAGNDLAFKNKIINGDFSVWQRGTSGSATDSYASADRWKMARVTLARQSHTPGTSWTQSQYYGNFSWTSQQNAYIGQSIENVVLLAGKTVTLSYWAKSSTSSTIAYFISQKFGTGGSNENVVVNFTQTQALTTSWAKYTLTVSLPSASGKTLGDSNTSMTIFSMYGWPKDSNTTGSIDISDVQLEIGSTATPFETRPPMMELALCQRYFESTVPTYFVLSKYDANKSYGIVTHFKVQKRTNPTFAYTGTYVLAHGSGQSSFTNLTLTTDTLNPYIHTAYINSGTYSSYFVGLESNTVFQYSAEL